MDIKYARSCCIKQHREVTGTNKHGTNVDGTKRSEEFLGSPMMQDSLKKAGKSGINNRIYQPLPVLKIDYAIC